MTTTNESSNPTAPVQEAPQPSFLKRYWSWLVLLLFVIALPVSWVATSKISGDVSVTVSGGTPAALQGAKVTLYEVTPEEEQHLTAALAELQRQNELEKAENTRVFGSQHADEFAHSSLAGYNNLSDTKHCFSLEKEMEETKKFAQRSETTDGQGGFSFRTPPGRYVVEIIGQQGNDRFEFVETVDLRWRTYLKLADATCHYSLTN